MASLCVCLAACGGADPPAPTGDRAAATGPAIAGDHGDDKAEPEGDGKTPGHDRGRERARRPAEPREAANVERPGRSSARVQTAEPEGAQDRFSREPLDSEEQEELEEMQDALRDGTPLPSPPGAEQTRGE